MIVLGVAATRNQLCPSRSVWRDAPSSRFSMTAPRSSQASAVGDGLTHPQLRLGSNASGHAQSEAKPARDRLRPAWAIRLGDPGRHAGKIDGRGCRMSGMAETWVTLLMLGFSTRGILPSLAVRSVPTFPRSALPA